jgi:NADPH:quinone reductase-like Zn-dependent oxidoreductase
MLSLEFEREGDPLEVIVLRKDAPMPTIAEDEVLVRALARPINAGEMLYVQGEYGVRAERFPAKLGIEGMGCIVELGAAVKNQPGGALRNGQRVHCYVDLPRAGTWAEYVSVEAKNCTPLPDEINDVVGSQVEVVPCTAMSMLHVLGVRSGDWLLQTAASSQVGKNVIEMCKMKGVRTINLIRRAHHVDELKSLGADEVLLTEEDDWQSRVRSLTDDEGVKYALDAVAGELGTEVTNLLGDDGCMLVYGLLSNTGLPRLNGRNLLFKQSGVKGFWLQKWARSHETKLIEFLHESVRLTASGKLRFHSKTYDLETQWRDAIMHTVKGGRTGRPVLVSPGVRGG